MSDDHNEWNEGTSDPAVLRAQLIAAGVLRPSIGERLSVIPDLDDAPCLRIGQRLRAFDDFRLPNERKRGRAPREDW